MFALVSTVGTLCAEFPRGVMLFRTEGEAYEFAASLLVLYDKHVSQVGSDWEWQSGPSEDDRDQYRTAACLVRDWQDSLHPTEYFHVMHVLDLPQTVHELFLDRDHESFVRSIEQMNQIRGTLGLNWRREKSHHFKPTLPPLRFNPLFPVLEAAKDFPKKFRKAWA